MRLPALLLLLAVTPGVGRAGTFLFAEDEGVNLITHPVGYTGSGGTVTVSVCIDPSSANREAMVVPVQHIVATWNARVTASPNLLAGAANDIPSNQMDFESVALHELGHCLGLDHPNLASESGLLGEDQEYTKTTPGPDGAYDLGIGTDGIRGSQDDRRDDDTNLHWFRRRDNNPFRMSGTIDASTYARTLGALPIGHRFAANADRKVGAVLGFPDTEAVMQQGAYADEAQRQLTADDVATLRLARSGLDMTAGTADDYALALTYGGFSAACSVVLAFDDSTSLAVSHTMWTHLNATHVALTKARISFGSSVNWFFTGSSSASTTTTTTASPSSTLPTTSSTGPTSTTTSTLPVDLCDDIARTACIAAAGGRLRIDERVRRLTIRMKALATPLDGGDFGDPVAGDTSYTVCVYDEQGAEIGALALARAGAACGRRPCWRALGGLGFRYTDRNGTVHGIRSLLLEGGRAGTGHVRLEAKVVAGRSVSGLPPGMPLALATSRLATVQLVGSDGLCLSLTTDRVLHADPERFSARRR